MNNPNVLLPYEDFVVMSNKASKVDAVLNLLGTEFPDDTCQLIAIKSVLGYVDPVEEDPGPTDPSDPVDPGTNTGDPTDPPTP